MSVQVYSLLGKTKEERKAFYEGFKKGGHIARLPPKALNCHKRWKSISFCEFWNNPTPPLFFIRPPYKWALQDMELYDKFVDRFQDISKVKDPGLLRAFKKKCFGGIWCCHIIHTLIENCSWYGFMKILKLIFQTHPWWLRNIGAEH